MLMYGPPEMRFERKKKCVVAAVLRDGASVLATQRGYGEWKGWWEFPGGKVQNGETNEEALAREMREEMEAEIVVERLLTTVRYSYPDFDLEMYCYLCELVDGKYTLKEHLDARWLTAETIHTVRWLPADEELIEHLYDMIDGTARS